MFQGWPVFNDIDIKCVSVSFNIEINRLLLTEWTILFRRTPIPTPPNRPKQGQPQGGPFSMIHQMGPTVHET